MMFLFYPLFNVLSIALSVMAITMLIPLLLLFGDTDVQALMFIESALLTLASAGLFKLLGRRHRGRLIQRQLFLVTAGSWIVTPLYGMIPFLMMKHPLSLADAFFECVSGFTTTGATVMSGLDKVPHDILLYRSILQWFGGIGIIAVAIAALPSLKTGGMKLFRTESSDWSEKATPRAHHMMSGLLIAYMVLSVLCCLCYWLAGMDVFNAVNHAMTTISTGGYSTSDASFAQFDSNLLHWIAIIFMLAGCLPFMMFVQAWHGRSLRMFKDIQIAGLLGIVIGTTVVLVPDVNWTGDMDLADAITLAAFNVTSIVSTTGFASSDYSLWGNTTHVAFFFLTFIGGCSGSTAGGVKIFRCQLFFIQLKKQLIKSIHPNSVIATKYGNRMVTEDIMQSCIAYLFLLMTSLIIVTFLLSMTGLDLVTSLTGAATAFMNVGPGLGEIIGPAGNFAPLTDTAKWLLSIAMILGRLEFIAIIILFTRTFWRG
jgi:trk system potassium uptake protein TrkH